MHGLLMRRRVLAAAAGAAAAAVGVPTRAQAQNAQGSKGAAGATRRIVSVGGAVTETIYLLGAQAELVGADTTSLHPAVAQQLPSVGYARALSAEGLLSLAPTLVLASAEAGPPAVLRQLEAARVPVRVFDAGHRFEGVLARTRGIAEAVARPTEGDALAGRLHADWQASLSRVAELARQGELARGKTTPRVLFVLSHSMAQLRIGGRGTAADAVIGYAGGHNAAAELDGFKPLTPEAAIAAAPDTILATTQGLEAAGGIDGLLKAPGLAATPAGRARRVLAFEALFMLGFGPRLPQAVLQVAAALHAAPGRA